MAVAEADALLTGWSYSVTLVDLAGNAGEGVACTGSGSIDAVAPQIAEAELSTIPDVHNQAGELLLATGHEDRIVAVFKVEESIGLAAGSPKVFLGVAGAPIAFGMVTKNSVEGGYECEYQLKLDKDEHGSAEGLWPVNAEVEDLAGNVTVVEGLGGGLVRVDFTAPGAECTLIPAVPDAGYGVGQKVTLQVFPLEELEKDFAPVLTQTFVPELLAPYFEYEEGSAYRYSREVDEGDGQRTFEAGITLRDLVGNETPPGQTLRFQTVQGPGECPEVRPIRGLFRT